MNLEQLVYQTLVTVHGYAAWYAEVMCKKYKACIELSAAGDGKQAAAQAIAAGIARQQAAR